MPDISDAWDAREIVDMLEEMAGNTLQRHGIDSWPILAPVPEHIQAVIGRPTFPVWSMPSGTPAEAQRAGRVLEVLRVVRGFLYSAGTLNDAVILGMRLGIAIEEAGLADLVPLAKRRVKVDSAADDRIKVPSDQVRDAPRP